MFSLIDVIKTAIITMFHLLKQALLITYNIGLFTIKLAFHILPKQDYFYQDSILVLHTWFNENKDNLNPSEEIKHELSGKCNMSTRQVHDWIANKRKQTKSFLQNEENRNSQKRKEILANTFITNTRPKKEQIAQIAAVTQLSDKTISKWFANERYKLKKNNSTK